MPTIRSGDPTLDIRIPAGEALTVTAPAGSSVYVVHRKDMDPAATVSGASRVFGPYAGTKTLTVTCTAGAVDYRVAAGSVDARNDAATGAALGEDNIPTSWATLRRPGRGQDHNDVNAIMDALAANGGGTIMFPPSTTPYVFDGELLLRSGVSVILSPGVTLTRPDPITLTCSTTSGSANITLVTGDTTRLKTGFYSAHYITGTGIQLATRVSLITGTNTLTMDKTASATGTVSLTFYPGHNIIRASNVSNVRVIAPWGRATLDGNGASSPLTFDSADSLRNCLQISGCTDVEVSGLMLTNAHYHGFIGVNNSGNVRYSNIRTLNNGFRGLHCHGDSPSSALLDLWADEIESVGDGYKGFQVQANDLNAGIYLSFDNVRRHQIGRLRTRRIIGLGVTLTGAIPSGTRSSQLSYESIVAEDTYIALGVLNGVKQTRVGSVQAKGTRFQVSGATLGNTTSQLPRYTSSGSGFVASAVMMPITLPGGTDMTQFYQGMAVYLQDIGANYQVLLRIWSVDAANRIIQVFHNSSDGVTRPWAAPNDLSTQLVTFGTGVSNTFLNPSTTLVTSGLYIGSIQSEGLAGKTITTINLGAATYGAEGIVIGSIQQIDCQDGAYFFSIQGLSIGSFVTNNCYTGITGNDTASVDCQISNCNFTTIGSFYGNSQGTSPTTRNGSTLLNIGSGALNTKVMACTAQNTNSSNFAVGWNGTTNTMVGDFRNLAGTTLTPAGTGTNTSLFKYGLT